MRAIRLAVPLLVATLAGFLGCGGGGGTQAVPSGTLTVAFGSDSIPGYSQAVVSLERIEATQNGANWATLGTVKATFDLMALQGGSSRVVLPAQSVAVGTYTRFRLTWATTNYSSGINKPAYVVPQGGPGQELAMPFTTTLTGSVTVTAGASTEMLLMLNGDQAVLNAPSSSTPYVFNATGKAYDLAACGRIAGKLTTSAGGTLSGVEVYGETLDGLGVATLGRRALSDASGNYVLEGLPTGRIYYAVAQPPACAGRASAPVSIATAGSSVADLAFGDPQTTGLINLAITPASTAAQGTWGELRQSVPTGNSGSSQNLIVRSQPAVTTTLDTVPFDSLVPGTYGVTAQRSTSGATAIMNNGTQKTVQAGGTTSLTLTF